MAPQTGFTDTNVGYSAATANTQQSPGMPFKSATVEHQLAYQQRGTAQHHQQPQYQYGGQTTTGYTQVGILQKRQCYIQKLRIYTPSSLISGIAAIFCHSCLSYEFLFPDWYHCLQHFSKYLFLFHSYLVTSYPKEGSVDCCLLPKCGITESKVICSYQ